MDIIDQIIQREGSQYTNDPIDAGGPTRYGVTLETLSKYRGHPVTASDVEHLTETEARALYATLYVASWGWVSSVALRELLVDSGVNCGLFATARFLQTALGVTVDGNVGSVTRSALNGADPVPVRLRVVAERMKYYGRVVHHNESQARFISGWLNRLAEFLP